MGEIYRYQGNKEKGDGTKRRILEGTVADPKRFVDVGGEIELSESEATALRNQGAHLVKLSEEQASKKDEDNSGDSSGSSSKHKRSG